MHSIDQLMAFDPDVARAMSDELTRQQHLHVSALLELKKQMNL